jgi:hypothetical protein
VFRPSAAYDTGWIRFPPAGHINLGPEPIGTSNRCNKETIANAIGRRSPTVKVQSHREYRKRQSNNTFTSSDIEGETMNVLSLGFDIRLLAEDYVSAVWSSEHRRRYLLREEIAWPMSVDRVVWPSMLEPNYFTATASRIPNPKYIGGQLSELENDIGFIPQWREVISLTNTDHGVPVGLELAFLDGDSIDQFVDIEAEGVPENRRLLGFDVATAALISGLCNCGYNENEAESLRRKWGRILNEHGLLPTFEQALDFRVLSNLRVPEHAPFFIFRLSQLINGD